MVRKLKTEVIKFILDRMPENDLVSLRYRINDIYWQKLQELVDEWEINLSGNLKLNLKELLEEAIK